VRVHEQPQDLDLTPHCKSPAAEAAAAVTAAAGSPSEEGASALHSSRDVAPADGCSAAAGSCAGCTCCGLRDAMHAQHYKPC
jgi:hypothetical protein